MESTKQLHPSQRFQAPDSIQKCVPLKEILGKELIGLIGESMESAIEGCDVSRFRRAALRGLAGLELNQRAAHIGRAMASQLPADFEDAAPLLLSMFGPELQTTEGFGLAPFFYLPHSHVIAERGVDTFETGMRVNYELTKRMTAEFSIRPFLVRHRDRTLELLAQWTRDPNPHVRRLVSEGTRPRLPWAMRLKEFQSDPRFTLPLLEKLKDDPEMYVRRSVANHLGDLLKDHPKAVMDVCERWVTEVRSKNTPRAKARRWLVRHAVRHPAKKGNRRALAIRAAAADPR